MLVLVVSVTTTIEENPRCSRSVITNAIYTLVQVLLVLDYRENLENKNLEKIRGIFYESKHWRSLLKCVMMVNVK